MFDESSNNLNSSFLQEIEEVQDDSFNASNEPELLDMSTASI